MLRPMKGLLTASWWQMTVKAGLELWQWEWKKVNLVIIWILVVGKGKCQGRLLVTSVLDI